MRSRRWLARGAALGLMGAALMLAGCGVQPTAVPRPAPASRLGIASWYGPGFNGRRTASGAIYDQEALTAATTVFPLGTRLRVTNLDNGRAVEVAVNDHGPYVKGRTLDLSHQAARRLGMLRRGTAPVRMDVLHTPPGGAAVGPRYFVQVASFTDAARARALAARLAGGYPQVQVTAAAADGLRRYRVRVGAFGDRPSAQLRAARLSRQGYRPKIVIE